MTNDYCRVYSFVEYTGINGQGGGGRCGALSGGRGQSGGEEAVEMVVTETLTDRGGGGGEAGGCGGERKGESKAK